MWLQIAAKHGVNAAILSAVQVYHDPADNNFHSWHGLYGIAWIIFSAVGARELAVFLPKLLKWSQTGTESDPQPPAPKPPAA